MNDVPFTYTRIPNSLLDKYLPGLTGSELKMLLIIGRKTCGFHKSVDRIAVSTFMKLSGMARDTVISALKSLESKGLIKRNRATSTHSYKFSEKIIPEEAVEKSDFQKSDHGSISVPEQVGISNQKGVGLTNHQKKTLKQNKINTTSTNFDLTEDFIEICNYWKYIFHTDIDQTDEELIFHVEEGLKKFSLKELKKAIFNRSKSDFYKNEKPYLRSKPISFFKYPETIYNDLNRKLYSICTYEEMCHMVMEKNLIMDKDFRRLEDQLDDQGRSLWEKI
ncbi:MAG: replication protein [Candidatus Paceibacterota bacterium]